MRRDLRRALLSLMCLAMFLSLVVATDASPAAAQGKPAPKSNQAFLYEMSENAVLVNYLGHVLLPDPTGTSPTKLIDSMTGATTIPEVVPVSRNSVSELQGVAALGTPLCPSALLITIPKLRECTVTVAAGDNIPLTLDSSGHLIPGPGVFFGTYAVVIQLDNSVDSPEWPLQTGAFYGELTFASPLGFSTKAFVNIGGDVAGAQGCTTPAPQSCIPFNATFRQPFTMSAKGHHKKPERGEDAFYLRDNGKLQEVRQDERAVGWPTVRFEINF